MTGVGNVLKRLGTSGVEFKVHVVSKGVNLRAFRAGWWVVTRAVTPARSPHPCPRWPGSVEAWGPDSGCSPYLACTRSAKINTDTRQLDAASARSISRTMTS